MSQAVALYSVRSRETAKRLIDAAPDGAFCEVKPPRRSDEQSRKMWALLGDISRAKPEGRVMPPEVWKSLFMDLSGKKPIWEPSLSGHGVVCVGYKSSRLTIGEMSDVIEAMYAYGSEHDVNWSNPE
jgi:hypothetical protein